MEADNKHNTVNTSDAGNLLDLSYKHLATLRSFDQIESRTTTNRDFTVPIPAGLESIAAARKIEMTRKVNEGDSQPTTSGLNYDIFNEEKQKIYRVSISKKWTGEITCELFEAEGATRVLSTVVNNKGLGCCKRTIITVIHGRNTLLGSVVYKGRDATLYNSDGNKSLRILTHVGEGGHVKHSVVEIDNTGVGQITNNSIKFTNCIDVKQRALLFGALCHYLNIK